MKPKREIPDYLSLYFETTNDTLTKEEREIIRTMVPIISEYMLTDNQKLVIDLFFVKHMRQIEIAKKINISQPSVSRHFIAAKTKINAFLHFVFLSHNFCNIIQEPIPTDTEFKTVVKDLKTKKDILPKDILPFGMEGKCVLVNCGKGKLLRGYIEFVDDTGNVYIELKNGKHLSLTPQQVKAARGKAA